MTNERAAVYIRGERHETTTEPPARKPPEHEVMDDAMDRLRARREGEGSGSADSETDEDRAARLRSTDDAAAALRVEQQQQRERIERERENARQAEVEQADSEIKQAAEWHPDDQAVINEQLKPRFEQFESDARRFQQAQAWAQQHPDQLTADHRRELAQEAQRLQEERNQLQQAAGKVQETAQLKSAEAERRKLYRDFPELKDPANREKLLKYAAERGIPRDIALGETRRDVTGRVWKQVQKEESEARQRRLDRPRKPVAKSAGTPSEMTPRQAREQLRKSGKMEDAINAVALARERAREASEDE